MAYSLEMLLRGLTGSQKFVLVRFQLVAVQLCPGQGLAQRLVLIEQGEALRLLPAFRGEP